MFQSESFTVVDQSDGFNVLPQLRQRQGGRRGDEGLEETRREERKRGEERKQEGRGGKERKGKGRRKERKQGEESK